MSLAAVIQWIIKPMPIWQSLLYFIMLFLFVSIIMLVIIFLRYHAITKKDILIFLEESDRFRIVYDDLRGVDVYKTGKSSYINKKPRLNSRGKALQIWTENKPQPSVIEHNKLEWLSADALTAVINNEIIKRLVELSSKLKDTLLLLGSISGIIGAMASITVLLIQLGVIKR